MRQLSENIRYEATVGNLDPFVLLRIWNDTEQLHASTTLNTNYTYAGVTYAKNSPLISLEAPKLSSTVDRSEFKLSIADPSFEFGNNFESNLTGARMQVTVGFINSRNGQAYTGADEFLIAYRGRVAATVYQIEAGDDKSITLNIAAASPMFDLDRKRGIRINKTAYRARYPNDSACDQQFDGSAKIVLRWGKI